MDLREYLFKRDMRFTEFARLIDYHPTYIRNISRGRFKAGKHFINAVKHATNGQVTKEDFESLVDNQRKIA